MADIEEVDQSDYVEPNVSEATRYDRAYEDRVIDERRQLPDRDIAYGPFRYRGSTTKKITHTDRFHIHVPSDVTSEDSTAYFQDYVDAFRSNHMDEAEIEDFEAVVLAIQFDARRFLENHPPLTTDAPPAVPDDSKPCRRCKKVFHLDRFIGRKRMETQCCDDCRAIDRVAIQVRRGRK